ncbi:MAG: O-antigen ligase family protein [Candidatus Obscuribacterales bacterium]|nr:O-antigen ligase family protein [Candidatus Obscuribacterales bacterium]
MTAEFQKSEAQQSEAKSSPSWLSFVERAELFLAVAYAVSLPLSQTATWVLLALGVAAWVLSALSRKLLQLPPLSTGWAPLTIPLLIFVVALTISGAFNSGSSPGQIGPHCLKESVETVLGFKSVFPYFWAFRISRISRVCSATAIVFLLWVSAAAGIWGGIQQVFNIHSGFKYLQGTGFLFHPMAYAGQMQIFSMLALGLLLSGGYKKLSDSCLNAQLNAALSFSQNNEVFALITMANFVGLLFAGERSAWLGGFAAVIAIAIVKSWRFGLLSTLAMLGAGGLSWLFIPLVKTRLSALASGNDISVSVRKRIWLDCLNNYFPQSPIFGVGLRKFPHFDIPEAIVPGVSIDINHGHSNYVHILTATGVLGFASYILLICWTFVAAVKKVAQSLNAEDKYSAGVAMGVFGAAVSLAIAGLFEFNFGTAQVRLAQWFIFGLL